MHGLMSGDGKRGYKLPRPSSTLLSGGIEVLRSFMNLDWGETGTLIAQDVVVSGSAFGSILPKIPNLAIACICFYDF
jgi:hypothetical protein